jgi:hypothetical protein
VTLIATRLGDDQSQVGIDHPLLRGKISALDPLGQLDLFGRGQERMRAGLPEEQLQRLNGA